jgi:hypothetical protein
MARIISSETNSFSASHEFTRILWNQKIIYGVHISRPFVIILSHINPVYDISFYTFIIHFNIIFPFKPTPSKRSLSFRFPYINPVCIFIFSIITNLQTVPFSPVCCYFYPPPPRPKYLPL